MNYRYLLPLAFITSIFNHQVYAAEHYLGFGFGPASTDKSTLEKTSTARLLYGYGWGIHGTELEVSQADYSVKGENTLSVVYRNIIASYLYFYDINSSIRMYGKAGINFWHADNQDFGTSLSSDSGNSLAIGLGARASLGQSFAMSLEIQRMPDVDNNVISLATVTFMYRFF